MNIFDHGGPAYPVEMSYGSGIQTGPSSGMHVGMTMRQWYAGMALQGLLSAGEELPASLSSELVFSVVAKLAFDQADAMIAHERRDAEAKEQGQ